MQYGEFAQVYDELMYDVPYEKWVDFIVKKLGKVQNVLELGCGTGNVTQLLASRFDVTALDISEEMLEVAAQKLRKGGKMARLVQGDMCDFKLHRSAEAAVCICDGINYLTEKSKVLKAFKNVRNNVIAGGLFIFDISSEYKLKQMNNQLYSEDNEQVTYIWRNSFDEETKCINMDISFFVCQGDNEYVRFDEVHTQRAHSIEEIKECLKKADFKVISVSDDYSDETVKTDSMRITFVAQAI